MKTQFILAIGCIAATLQVQAASVLKPIELSDAELSQLRGRFVLPDRIISFGVSMSSVWQNANGQVLGANMNMQVQNQFDSVKHVQVAKPVFNVTMLNSTDNNFIPTPAKDNGQVYGGAGLNQVQGVAQSVRAAGDYNQAGNGMTIDVSNANSAPALPAGSSSLDQSITTNAGIVSVKPANGGVQLAIQATGQGASLQSIGAGGVAQNIALTGNSNLVQNLATLSVVMRNNPAALNNINCAWDQLRTLRPTGY